jgi:hypothetical protein
LTFYPGKNDGSASQRGNRSQPKAKIATRKQAKSQTIKTLPLSLFLSKFCKEIPPKVMIPIYRLGEGGTPSKHKTRKNPQEKRLSPSSTRNLFLSEQKEKTKAPREW